MKENESVESLVVNLFKFISVKIEARDINSCYRVGKSSKVLSHGEIVYPTIVVDLVRENVKSEVLQKLKYNEKPFTSVDLGFMDVAISTIYVNEGLTPYMWDIFKAGRKAKKEGHLKFLWKHDGIVHGRVADGTDVLRFLCVNDILAAISEDGLEGNTAAAGNEVVISRSAAALVTNQLSNEGSCSDALLKTPDVIRPSTSNGRRTNDVTDRRSPVNSDSSDSNPPVRSTRSTKSGNKKAGVQTRTNR